MCCSTDGGLHKAHHCSLKFCLFVLSTENYTDQTDMIEALGSLVRSLEAQVQSQQAVIDQRQRQLKNVMDVLSGTISDLTLIAPATVPVPQM